MSTPLRTCSLVALCLGVMLAGCGALGPPGPVLLPGDSDQYSCGARPRMVLNGATVVVPLEPGTTLLGAATAIRGENLALVSQSGGRATIRVFDRSGALLGETLVPGRSWGTVAGTADDLWIPFGLGPSGPTNELSLYHYRGPAVATELGVPPRGSLAGVVPGASQTIGRRATSCALAWSIDGDGTVLWSVSDDLGWKLITEFRGIEILDIFPTDGQWALLGWRSEPDGQLVFGRTADLDRWDGQATFGVPGRPTSAALSEDSAVVVVPAPTRGEPNVFSLEGNLEFVGVSLELVKAGDRVASAGELRVSRGAGGFVLTGNSLGTPGYRLWVLGSSGQWVEATRLGDERLVAVSSGTTGIALQYSSATGTTVTFEKSIDDVIGR